MDKLPVGFRATVEVVEVDADFEQISNGTIHCHLTVFRLDDQSEYRGQQCTSIKVPAFMAGDIIDISIKAFTKGIYTFILEKVHPKLPNESMREAIMKTKAESVSVGDINPPVYNIAGSPGAIGLQAAVTHNANRVGIKAEQVVADAEIFTEFLRNNTF